MDNDHIEHLFHPNYMPDNQDILYAKSRTIGIVETVFELENHTYRMIDVGGQRSERRKWIKAFDGVGAVLFVAAISAYDVFVPEDPNQSQVDEALMLFKEISNLPIFKSAALILFLNKIDLLSEKLESGMSPIGRYYPDFTGEPGDVAAGQAFFEEKFKRLFRDKDKALYIHFTNATDTAFLNKTMDSVQLMILQHNFKTLML
jgi:guanine nucleotide-binding protein subunit alpha